MKKRLLLPIAVFFLAGAFFYFCQDREKSKNTSLRANEERLEASSFHSAFHMDKEFYGDLEKVPLTQNAGENIQGGVTSHHFLVAKEIAKFLSTLKKQSPETVVIIGPNHFDVGKGNILVSKYPYETPWGIVYPEEGTINELIEKKTTFNDEDPFSREHSISALVGFIKYYLPDTKIVPIIIKRGTSREKAENLAQSLNEVLPDDAVVVSSVDFSHHLSRTASIFHDAKSISAISNFEYQRVLDSEIDSPISIYALLRYLELRGAHKMEYENINSADFSGNSLSSDVTSYLFAHFRKGSVQVDDKISVLSFGDMMFARDVGKSVESGTDPFEKIKGPEGNFLRGVDIISASLEEPITEISNCPDKAHSFRFDPGVANLIAGHGINLVNLSRITSKTAEKRGWRIRSGSCWKTMSIFSVAVLRLKKIILKRKSIRRKSLLLGLIQCLILMI